MFLNFLKIINFMGLLIESVKATFSVLKKCPQVLVFSIIYFTFSQLLSVEGLLTFPLIIFICFLYIFIALLYTATFQLVVKSALSSRRVSLMECISSGLKKLHKVLGLGVLLGLIGIGFATLMIIPMSLIIARSVSMLVAAPLTTPLVLLPLLVIGIIAVIIAGIYVFTRLTFSIPILMIENSGIIESMKRSWKASKGKFWSIVGAFSLMSLLFIPMMIAMSVFGIIYMMHQNPELIMYDTGLASSPPTFSLAQFILLIALGVVPLALMSFLPAAYYMKIKMRKEKG